MEKSCRVLVSVAFLLTGSLSASDLRYEYNARSELTRVTRAGEVLYGYEYDLAGNLIWSCNGSRTNVYERNCLNQYTTVSDSEGNVYRFTYDEDGNLVQDNRRVYIWDSDSRLEASRPLPGAGGFAIRNSYDTLGRRVKKDAWYVAPFGTYPPERPISTTTYVFDGGLLVRETIEEIGGTVKQTEYTWGKDISGSLDGAGGVGGLLAVKIDGATYVPIYDVGGNITGYCSSSGSVIAERNYSPFGQMISARSDNDPLFRRLHFWFSTKYLDLETGLYYFGGRFYSPFLCRWLNRDPIGEQGGLNLYAFCRNDPINNYDPNGCAYFIKRKLDYLPWIKNFSANANLDGKNLELVHEHLVYEDGGKSTGVGYFWGSEKREDNNWKNVKWVRVPGWYNDCVMRKAEERVRPRPYNILTYNCQDYAEDLRRKYKELIRDKKIRCECKVDGRRKH